MVIDFDDDKKKKVRIHTEKKALPVHPYLTVISSPILYVPRAGVAASAAETVSARTAII